MCYRFQMLSLGQNKVFDEKTAIKRVQNDACISYAEREQARPKVKTREQIIFDERTRFTLLEQGASRSRPPSVTLVSKGCHHSLYGASPCDASRRSLVGSRDARCSKKVFSCLHKMVLFLYSNTNFTN